ESRAGGKRILRAQLVNRWNVDAQHVDDASARVGGRRAPICPALCAGNRHGVFVGGWCEQPLVTRVRDSGLPLLALFGRQNVRIYILDGEGLTHERRRSRGNWLRRPRPLAAHVTGRDRPLLDGPYRLTRRSIEHVQKPGLSGLRNDVDRLSVAP